MCQTCLEHVFVGLAELSVREQKATATGRASARAHGVLLNQNSKTDAVRKPFVKRSQK